MFKTSAQRLRLAALLWLTAAVMGLSLSPPAGAQVPSAELNGVVSALDGSPVQEAVATIVHLPTGTTNYAAVIQGRFAASGLRVGGPYQVSISAEGQEGGAEDLFLKLDEPTTVRLTLQPQAVTLETVEVIGSRSDSIFNPDNVGSGTTISKREVESLPTISRSLNDFVRVDPRVVVVDKARGELSVAGQNNRYNSILIDGVGTNDEFGLEANGLPSLSQPFALEWIDSLALKISPYDVTEGGFTGGSINAVTKSGSNRFGGSAYYNYRDADYVGEDENGNEFGDFEETVFGLTASGPIVKDKLFFFVGYEEYEQTVPPSPVGLLGSNASTVFPASSEDIQRIIDITQGYGYDPGSTSTPALQDKDEKILAKLDWNIIDGQRLSLRYNKNDSTQVNVIERDVDDFALSSYFYDDELEFENYVLQWFSNWTPTFSTQVQVSQTEFDKVPVPGGGPFPDVLITVQDANNVDVGDVHLGTERFRHANSLNVKTTNADLVAEWFRGRHSLKFGADWEVIEFFNEFVESSFGRYEFDNIDQYAAGTPSFYTLRIGADPANPYPAADWAYDTYGLFLQDTWQLTSNFNLVAGLRWDFTSTSDEPQFNADFQDFYGFSNTATIDGQEVLQPRVGFNWDVLGEGSTQLRGGVGLFLGSSPGVWLSNPFTNPGGTISVYTSTDGFNPSTDPDEIVPDGPGTAPRQDVDVLEEDFQLPTVWRANLAMDQKLGWGVIGSAELIVTDVEKDIFYQHLNLGEPTGFLPDGRESYYADPSNPVSGTTRANQNFTFNDVIQLKNTSKGETQQMTFALEKLFQDHWSIRGAYTIASASNVNPGTSSRAVSNWNTNAIYNPNDEEEGRSNYEINERFSLSAVYQRAFVRDLSTSLGMFFEHRAGRPYSWTFSNDANGDGVSGNDLLYVPEGPGDVIFMDVDPTIDEEAAFFELVDSSEGLRGSRGEVVPRNSDRSGYVTQMDLRFVQEFFGAQWGRGQVSLDLINFTNLLNDEWGQIDQVGFPYRAGAVQFAGVSADGRYMYSYNGRTKFDSRQDSIGESRWSALLGVKLTFGG